MKLYQATTFRVNCKNKKTEFNLVLKKRRIFSERMIYLPSMIFTFLKLQWKSFFRGESVGVNVMTKVLKWFWIVYFGFITPLLGFLTYKVLKGTKWANVDEDDFKRKIRDRRPFSLSQQKPYLCFCLLDSNEVFYPTNSSCFY